MHLFGKRFQVNKKPKLWRDSFLVERGKLLHQLMEGKEVSQEENFLPKHQRVKDLCQRAEYQTPCQQTGQNEGGAAAKIFGRQRPLSIKSQKYRHNSEDCDCDLSDLRPLNPRPSMMRPFNKKPFFSKKKFKTLKSYSRNRYSRSVSMTNSYPGNDSMVGGEDWPQPISDEDEFSGMGGDPNGVSLPNSHKVTHKCFLLPNATVKCDTGVYQSLQAWKDHKLHIDHEIETLQTKIKNLREVRGHLKKARPLKCDCNKYLFKSKLKNKLRFRGGGHPFSANNNTYWCLRTINETHNFLFCEFATGFLEYFDLTTDPYQLINAVSSLDRTVLNQLHVQLMELRACRGHKQCNPRTRSMEPGGRDHGSFDDYRMFERKKWPRIKKPSSSRTLGPIWDGWKG
ncbi:Extracellular sulfatase Sulf-2 [Dissostichus eleginoides]|uniref:Extracellular sulfatase Sulf-2 n=1 Tax=Dissostichus eleginoides TaxID=100907 RepID=A0AAD9FGT0_DISEL|nr:Extracellular sulfatase Sulf-2 [Dissostichus eleginoides]